MIHISKQNHFIIILLCKDCKEAVQFDSIEQFGSVPDYISSRYVLYSGENCVLQYTFREITYDIPAGFTSVNLSIIGTNYWWIVETNSSGTAVWNIPINLIAGNYDIQIALNPAEFDPVLDFTNITTTYRSTSLSKLSSCRLWAYFK